MKKDILTKNEIIPEKVKIFHGEDYIGSFNEYEFNDLRVRIKEKYKGQDRFITDYHVYKSGIEFYIDSHGRIEGWQDQFFGLIQKQLGELIRF